MFFLFVSFYFARSESDFFSAHSFDFNGERHLDVYDKPTKCMLDGMDVETRKQVRAEGTPWGHVACGQRPAASALRLRESSAGHPVKQGAGSLCHMAAREARLRQPCRVMASTHAIGRQKTAGRRGSRRTSPFSASEAPSTSLRQGHC
eukprot:scaffold4452_cov218-Pinguiococcus_pyrenoidosus.AAC.2